MSASIARAMQAAQGRSATWVRTFSAVADDGDLFEQEVPNMGDSITEGTVVDMPGECSSVRACVRGWVGGSKGSGVRSNAMRPSPHQSRRLPQEPLLPHTPPSSPPLPPSHPPRTAHLPPPTLAASGHRLVCEHGRRGGSDRDR